MAKCWNKVVRGVCLIAGSGLLLQAGACSVDPTQTALGLTNSIVGNFLASVIFSLFSVPLGRGF